MKNELELIIANRNVLFITTKNIDYIRNKQEMEIIKKNAKSYKVIGSYDNTYFRRIIYVFFSIIKMNIKNYDIVFIGFLPQLVLPFFYLKFREKTIIIDFFISLYDTLIFDRDKVRQGSVAAGLIKYIDKKTLFRANYIVTDTKAHAKYFINELKADENKIVTVYLDANKSIYYRQAVKKDEELKGKFIVLYFGSILPLQGVEIILDTIRMLQNNNEIFFMIIGPIKDKVIRNFINLKNVKFIKWLSERELAKYINLADLCLAGHFNDKIDKAKRTIAGKTYIYRAVEKPVILGDNEANRELFSERDKDIYFVEMGSSEKLKDKILGVFMNTNKY